MVFFRNHDFFPYQTLFSPTTMDYVSKKLLPFAAFLWVSFSTLFIALFRFLSGTPNFRMETTSSGVSIAKSSNLIEPEIPETENEPGSLEVSECEGLEEEKHNSDDDKPKFVFKFEYQTYREEQIEHDLPSSSSTNKYEFLPGEDLSRSIKEPEAVRLTVKECFSDSGESFADRVSGNMIKGVEEEAAYAESRVEKLEQTPAEGLSKDEEGMKPDEVSSKDEADVEAGLFVQERSIVKGKEVVDPVLPSEESMAFEYDELESIASTRSLSSTGDGLLSDYDSEEEDLSSFVSSLNSVYRADDDLEDEDSNYTMEELHKEVGSEVNDTNDSKDGYVQSKSSELRAWDSEDGNNGLEVLWEHQDLIEQMQMELKKVKATGLPTILEDDECPRIVIEDLKPWKIEEKFHHQDRMSELHRFYRSYRERMRKFDILNYQKMYATSFLQTKDPLESMPSTQKSEAPALTSLFSQKLMLLKRKKSAFDPMENFVKELQSALETVYVGQMCLSWEILHWQYQKALELYDSDHFSRRRYNEVAGEFQQFQVLLQRFIENEPFEGPRLQNYVRKRVVMRNLLQVPMIREDGSKDKKARRREKDAGTITSDELVEILEESIRIMWRFIRTDKDANSASVKLRKKGTQIQSGEDPARVELFTEVYTSLQKKEKRVKEMMRSGSCILRKFQKKQPAEAENNVVYFFCQVEMKLVGRVLNMSNITTEQLVWCRSKLRQINFVGKRMIHVDPSFSLFPC
ncbi:hypothetical protein LINPERHAP1_LOCUS37706 [Linum perenne]